MPQKKHKEHRTGPDTARLTHRTFELGDAEALYKLNSHPDVMRLTGEPPFPSIEATREAILNYPDFESYGFGRWACILKETNSIIGLSGLKYLPDLEAVDVGYRFLPEYWGRGLATETCKASLRFGFETLQLEEIIGLVLPENKASIRVLEKAGMQADGKFLYDGLQVLRFVAKRRGMDQDIPSA